VLWKSSGSFGAKSSAGCDAGPGRTDAKNERDAQGEMRTRGINCQRTQYWSRAHLNITRALIASKSFIYSGLVRPKYEGGIGRDAQGAPSESALHAIFSDMMDESSRQGGHLGLRRPRLDSCPFDFFISFPISDKISGRAPQKCLASRLTRRATTGPRSLPSCLCCFSHPKLFRACRVTMSQPTSTGRFICENESLPFQQSRVSHFPKC
jgi:hypothetical protein